MESIGVSVSVNIHNIHEISARQLCTSADPASTLRLEDQNGNTIVVFCKGEVALKLAAAMNEVLSEQVAV
jgi:hypothetical protein